MSDSELCPFGCNCQQAWDKMKSDAKVIAALREALIEAYEDNLYASLHDGVTGNEGKWWPGGMSTAEWFCRQAGIDHKPKFFKEDLLKRVPEIAAAMVQRAIEQNVGK